MSALPGDGRDLEGQQTEDDQQTEEERIEVGEVSRNGQKINPRKARAKVKSRTPSTGAAAERAGKEVAWKEPVEDWITFLKGGRKPTTVQDYTSRIGIVRRWAEQEGVTLDRFKVRDLDRFLAHRERAGLADSSRRHDAIIAKAFLKWAFQRHYLRSDPLYGYEIPKAQTAARVVPPAEDIGKLIAAVEDCWNVHKTPQVRFIYDKARRFYAARDLAIIIGIVATGARISEMLGVRLEDWRPDLNQIAFRQTKNGEPRFLPVSALWVPYVEAYLKLRPRCDNPFLFVNADGGSLDKAGRPRPIPQTTWARAWKRYMEKAGLSGWSRHNLRHFAATHMAVDHGNLMLANGMLGHKDLKTTKIYAHNSVRQMQEAFARADPLKGIPILVNKRSVKGKPKLL